MFSWKAVRTAALALASLAGPFGGAGAAQTILVGATSGEAGVSPSGAATYSVPITVPVGTTGVQPALALSYSGQGGNGALGVGWSITGLASMSRCQTDLYMDDPDNGGVGIDPVDYDDNDKLCLNGQRLTAISGTYLGDEAEYRTALEEFSKVTSHHENGMLARFVVRKQNGDILHFGCDANSRMLRPDGSAVRSWALCKIEDQRGNYIKFEYDKDEPNGEINLSRVLYTGNDAQGLVPFNTVDFVYEARPDEIRGYAAGDPVSVTKRLQKVEVKTGATLFRRYALTYETGATGRSRLASLQECAGASGASCFAPTTFEWSGDGSQAFQKTTIGSGQELTAGKLISTSGDFNGDGLSDFYVDGDGGSDFLHLSNVTGGLTKSEITQASGLAMPQHNKIFATGDFNGDGLTDFLTEMPVNAQNGSHVQANGFFDFSNNPTPKPILEELHLAQPSGVFTKKTISKNAYVHPGASTIFFGTAYFHGQTIDQVTVMSAGDFNGDGLSDLFAYSTDYSFSDRAKGSHQHEQFLLSDGDDDFLRYSIAQEFFGCPLSSWPCVMNPLDFVHVPHRHEAVAAGDFNGDGLFDQFTMKVDKFSRKVATTEGPYNQGPDIITENYFFLADGPAMAALPREYGKDWETSGLGIVGDIPSGKANHALLKNAAIHAGAPPIPVGYRVAASGDFNGDGLTDVFAHKADTIGRKDGAATADDYVYLATGNDFFKGVTHAAGGGVALPEDHSVLASGDFNGDGYLDLYVAPLSSSGRRATGTAPDLVYLGDGAGGFTVQPTASGDAPFNEPMPANSTVGAVGDFNGDGRTDLYVYVLNSSGKKATGEDDYLYLSAWSAPDELKRVVNGHGLAIEFDLKPMTDASVYTKGTGATYPVQDVISASRVVAAVKTDDGLGGQNTQSYRYAGLKTHLKGFGSLGFRSMWVTDETTGIVTESTYSQDWQNHFQGLLERQRTYTTNAGVEAQLLSDQLNTWAVRFFPNLGSERLCFRFVSSSTTQKYDLNGADFGSVTETTAYDDYGFPTQIIQTTTAPGGAETFTTTTTNTYANDIANWRLGRLVSASVNHAAPGVPNQARTTAFTYLDGLLESETVEPGDALTYTKTYVRNAFGAVISETESWGSTGDDGIAATSRSNAYGYDATSRFRQSATNPLGHTVSTTHDPVHGLPLTVTDVNGLVSSTAYDAFGRVDVATAPDGSTTSTTREFCGGAVTCRAGALYRVTTTDSTGATSFVEFDKLGRKQRESALIQSQYSHRLTDYDNQGRVTQVSEPHFDGETVYWTTIQYDLLGRPTLTTGPDGATQTASYNGFTEISTNTLGQSKTVVKNVVGRVVQVLDAESQTIAYSHDALGQLIETNAAGAISSYAYDIRGNKISDSDPDKGLWTYRYNALGLLVEQTDAKGQVTELTYDVVGRMLTRTDDANAPNPQHRTASWVYDTAANGIGKLASAASANGYASTQTYDSLGRPSIATETIDGTAFSFTTTYDAFSRPETMAYPSGLTIRSVYDADGALNVVKDDSSGLEYWRRIAVDARGNLTQELLGNGVETAKAYRADNGRLTDIDSWKTGGATVQDLKYEFDLLGNLTRRESVLGGAVETFTYDTLNRLTQTAITAPGGPQTLSMSYDARGNILSKSDVGTYAYGAPSGSCGAGAAAGPHAVTAVTGAHSASYCYDANGNMTSGDGRSVAYTGFDKAALFVKGTETVSFAYGPDRARFKRVDSGLAGVKTTLYLGGKAVERIDDQTGPLPSLVYKHYIAGVAVITKPVGGSGSTTEYLHYDHLGSVESVTDSAGVVTQRMSFDAWGKRRGTDASPMTAAAIASFNVGVTTRGFTGHEMVDSMGLVHMNGRVYDPLLGRFLSADPHVQDPTNLQSYNRYTYVLNNPLSYTDPSGFFFKSLFKAIGKAFKAVFRAVRAVFKAILRAPILRAVLQAGLCFATGGPGSPGCIASSAAFSAGSTLAAGGSIGDALKSAAFTFAQAHVFSAVGAEFGGAPLPIKATIHGVVGGAFSVAQGGNFFQGFAANAVGAVGGRLGGTLFRGPGAGGAIGRTAIAALAGGTASVITGGKFANGAAAAAIAHLFNNESNFLVGRDAHQTLQNWLRRTYLSSARVESTLGGVLLKRRIDGCISIFCYSGEQQHFFEIKSDTVQGHTTGLTALMAYLYLENQHGQGVARFGNYELIFFGENSNSRTLNNTGRAGSGVASFTYFKSRVPIGGGLVVYQKSGGERQSWTSQMVDSVVRDFHRPPAEFAVPPVSRPGQTPGAGRGLPGRLPGRRLWR